MQILSNSIFTLNVCQSPKFKKIGVEEHVHGGDVRFQVGSGNTAVLRMRNEKYAIYSLFMAEVPRFSHLKGNRGQGTQW